MEKSMKAERPFLGAFLSLVALTCESREGVGFGVRFQKGQVTPTRCKTGKGNIFDNNSVPNRI